MNVMSFNGIMYHYSQKEDSRRGGSGRGTYIRGGSRPYQSRSVNNNSLNRYGNQGAYNQKRSFRGAYSQNYNGRNNYSGAYEYTRQQSYDIQNQLWMGDLDPSWDEDAIKKIWTSFGENPLSVKVIRDKFSDGKSPNANAGYCFVTFATQNEVSSAVLKNGLPIPGSTRTFKLNWASGGNHSNLQDPKHTSRGSSKTDNDFSVFVGDLAPDVTEQMLFENFEAVYPNQVKQVKIMTDPVTRISKGFGFVRLESNQVQQRALKEMNGVTIGKKQIRVGIASGNASQNNDAGVPLELAPAQIQIAQPQPPPGPLADPNNTTVFIKGLAGKFTDNEICSYFLSFGNIIFCELSYDRNNCTIKYELRADAENALLFMYGATINGCRLHIGWGCSRKNEKMKVKFIPSSEKDYAPEEALPTTYGHFKSYPIRYDKLNKQGALQLTSTLRDTSEDVSAAISNEEYMDLINYRDEVLESFQS